MSVNEDQMYQSYGSAKASFSLDSQHERLLKSFMIGCINKFIEKITLYSAIARGDKIVATSNFQKFISDLVKPIVSLLGSEIALPVNIGLSLISYTSYQIKSKLVKDKARKIADALDPHHRSILLIISLIVCDVCRMFENQIVMITETDMGYNKEVLTCTIVHRVLNYISKNKLADDINCITKADIAPFSEVLEVAKKGIVGVFEGESKKSSKILKINCNGVVREIICGNFLKWLPVLIENQKGQNIAYHRKDLEKQHRKIWGSRRSSLIAEPCFSYTSLSKDSKVNSEDYNLEMLHPGDLKSDICESQLSKVSDIESLKNYSIYLLKMCLCDSKTELIMDAMRGIQNLAEKVENWQEFLDQIKISLEQLTQLPTKTEVELLINPIYKELQLHASASQDMELQLKEVQENTKTMLQFTKDLMILVEDINNRKVRMLIKEANIIEPIFGMPTYPFNKFCIVRTELVNGIVKALQEFNEVPKHILVCGCGGSGKTVAVAHAIREFINSNSGNQYAIKWFKIGNIDNRGLLTVLNNIARVFEIKTTHIEQENLTKVHSILKYHLAFKLNYKVIFVFDDLLHEEHLKYLQFANNAIIISRIKTHSMLSAHKTIIETPEELTEDEAIKVLQLFQRARHLEYFKSDTDVLRAVRNCQKLPLAIALIGAQKPSTREGWHDVLNKVQKRDATNPMSAYYEFNLYQTFRYSIDNLPIHTKELFRQLGVFKKVKIPVSMISLIWKLPYEFTMTKLHELQDRSLVNLRCDSSNYTGGRNFCIIHDLITDHLRIPADERHGLSSDSYFRQLNENLISSLVSSGKIWSEFEDDDYFYQYILDHAIAAYDCDVVIGLVTSIEWLDAKLKACKTLYSIVADLDKGYEFIREQNKSTSKIDSLRGLLKQYASSLSFKTLDLTQFVLSIPHNISWVLDTATKIASKRRLNYPNSFYAKLWHTEENIYDTWKLSLFIGSGLEDTIPKVSNPKLGEFRMISSVDNSSQNPCIKVVNCLTTQEAFHKYRKRCVIERVRISGNGVLIGFCKILFHGLKRIYNWEIWNMDANIQLQFISKQGKMKNSEADFQDVEFSSAGKSNIITISADKKCLHLWSIENNEILVRNASACHDFDFISCRFVNQGNKLLSHSYNSQEESAAAESHLSYWDVKIWEVTTFLDHRAFYVPVTINRNRCELKDEQSGVKKGTYLRGIEYINDQYLLLNYTSTVMLLNCAEYDSQTVDAFHENLSKIYKPVLNNSTLSISVSDDSCFIAALSLEPTITVLKRSDENFSVYRKISCQPDTSYIGFIPGTRNVMAVDVSKSLQIYEVEEESKLSISMNENKNQDQVRAILYATSEFVNDVPVVAKAIQLQNRIVQLKVMKGDNLENVSYCDLVDHNIHDIATFYYCCLFRDLNRVVVIESKPCRNDKCHKTQRKYHWYLKTTMKSLDNINISLWSYSEKFEEESHYCFSIYRKLDNKLIITKILNESNIYHITIVDSENGEILGKHLDEYKFISKSTILYEDCNNIIGYFRTMQGTQFVKIYRLLHNKISVTETSGVKYIEKSLSACRIVLLDSGRTVVSNVYDINDDLFRDDLFEYDWTIFKDLKFSSYGLYFFIRKMDEFVVVNENHYIWAIGFKNCARRLDTAFLSLEDLWSKDYFMYSYGRKIFIYDRYALDLLQVLDIPIISSICKIRSNGLNTSLICKSYSNKFSIIKRIA